MGVKHCAHGNCKSDTRILKRDPSNTVFFVPFAKPFSNLEKCKRWISACHRENFEPQNITKHTYICSLHFVGQKGPTQLNPDPISATQSKVPNQRKTKRAALSEAYRPAKQLKILEINKPDINDSIEDVVGQGDATEAECVKQDSDGHDKAIQTEATSIIDQNVQTCSYIGQGRFENQIAMLKQQLQLVSFTCETCFMDPDKFKFYTSLTPNQFGVLFNMLGPDANNLRIWRGSTTSTPVQFHQGQKTLTAKSQLFLTLIRLRHGHLLKDLSYRFDVSTSYASKIINTWIMFLYNRFKQMPIFPPREKYARKLPKVFRKFKNIRVVIDCFEMRSESSSDYREQGNMYSSYKAHSTYKFLCGIHPSGAIVFLSDAFEGSISDREIFKQSGIIKNIHADDLIMADRGFNISDICNEIGCSLIIPPFLSGRDKFTMAEVRTAREISSARVHVERVIGRIKQFRLMQKKIPKTLIPLISQIAFVAAMLVNFQEPLVS